MYQPKQFVFSFALLPALLSSVCNGDELAGCVEVECPTEENSTTANCQVANQTLVSVGISSHSVSIPDQEDFDFAWTVGLQDYLNVDPENPDRRHIEHVYYLGTPPSVDLTADDLGFSGCAFYMTLPENKNVIYSPHNMTTTSQNTFCEESLGEECISALESRISKLAEEHELKAPESRTCSEIASDLESSLPSSCTSDLDKAIVRGVALTGPTAAGPISQSENSTTNCNPTLPQSNTLTRQFSYNISSSFRNDSVVPDTTGETPVLSLFWSNEGDDNSSIDNPSIELSCLRPIDMTTAGLDNQQDGGGEGAASTNGGSSLLHAAVTAGAVMLAFSWLT